MSNLKIYKYEGSQIIFEEIEGRIMANATLMAIAFMKKPDDVFKTKSWQEFEEAVIETKNLRFEDIRTVKNGENGGSWIHQELVIEFARRLNPKFSIWCNDRIAELLRTGSVDLPKKSETEQVLDVIKMLSIRLEQEKAEKEHVTLLLTEAKPKVEYYDKVINSEGLFPITLIAQQVNMTARRLNEILKEKKIQRRVNGTWVLTATYLNKGYANLKTYTFEDSHGQKRTNQQLQWTEKGKAFIMEVLGLVSKAA
jgi:phage antirepressor YoqD-like protein